MRRKVKSAQWVVGPDGAPVYAVAHARATVRGNSTVDADLRRLEEKIDSTGSFTVTDVLINPDAWQEDDEEGLRAVLPVTGATLRTVPLICVEQEDSAVARRCGLKSWCASGEGTVTVYAELVPSGSIRLKILAMFAQSVEADIEVSQPDIPMVVNYKLPVATKDTLGGVKIGSGIEVSEDGTITAKNNGCNHILSGGIAHEGHVHNTECMRDLIASTDEVNDALNRALGIDADPETPDQGADGDAPDSNDTEE